MAGIDKTYVTKEQLVEAYKWAKSIGKVTLENGHIFRPLDFIHYYDMKDLPELDEYVLWNTPTWFDRWLWKNCPLSFIHDRMKEVYDKETLDEFDSWTYQKPIYTNHKYKFIEVPIGKHRKSFMRYGRYKNPWPGKCIQSTYEISIGPIKNVNGKIYIDGLNEYGYDKQTDSWGHWSGMLPYNNGYIWQEYHKRIPNKKSILRQIRKWNIPSGYLVHFENIKHIGLDFKIIVK